MNYEKALAIATVYHSGQYRKNSGLPYIVHPIAVADKFRDETRKIVAVMHDTLEDTKLTTFDLTTRYKFNMNIVMAIKILTHRDDQSYLEYILECKNTGITKDVKIEDIKDNLSDKATEKLAPAGYVCIQSLITGETAMVKFQEIQNITTVYPL